MGVWGDTMALSLDTAHTYTAMASGCGGRNGGTSAPHTEWYRWYSVVRYAQTAPATPHRLHTATGHRQERANVR